MRKALGGNARADDRNEQQRSSETLGPGPTQKRFGTQLAQQTSADWFWVAQHD